MAPKKLPDLLTIQQSADYLGTTKQAISKALQRWEATDGKAGLKEATRYGRTILISRATLDLYKKTRHPGFEKNNRPRRAAPSHLKKKRK